MLPRSRFSALQHSCEEPGCNHWFRNLAGLTQHKRISHPCFSYPGPDNTELPGCFGQEDYKAERDPDADMFPLPEHNAEHAHQECGNSLDHGSESVRAEFVGPGNKVYRNYHTGLNGKSFAQLLS